MDGSYDERARETALQAGRRVPRTVGVMTTHRCGVGDRLRRRGRLRRTLTRVAASQTREPPVPTLPEHRNTSPPEPSGPSYSTRVALSCERGRAPGQVLHA